MRSEIVNCFFHCLILFFTKFVFNRCVFLFLENTSVFSKCVEHIFCIRSGTYVKPFCIWFSFDIATCQIAMELMVSKCVARSIVKLRFCTPFFMVLNICSMCLLFQSVFDSLLSISDFCPTVVSGNFRSRVGVNHWHYTFGSFDIRFCHTTPSPLHWFQ